MRFLKIILFNLFIFLVAFPLYSQPEVLDREIQYRPGDWIGYPMMRYAASITLGDQFVYFGTTNGISRYDFYQDRWEYPYTVCDGLADDQIKVVAYDFGSGYLWCASEIALSYLVPSSEQWHNLYYETLFVETVTSIGPGKEFLWIDTPDGLYKGDRTIGTFWESHEEEAAQDNIQWFGNRQEANPLPDLFIEPGYFYFPDGTIQDMQSRKFQIETTLLDRFDNFWMAIWGLGAGKADMKIMDLKLLPFGLYNSQVKTMAWDETGLWIGGIGHDEEIKGITYWDMEDGAWTYFESELITRLRGDRVYAIVVGTDCVWFGTDEGLACYDKDENTWRVYDRHQNLWDDRVYSLALTNSILWVGTEYGVNRIVLSGKVIEQVRDERLIYRPVYFLEADGADVWAGTDQGLYRYVDQDRIWEFVRDYPGMIADTIRAISVWNDEVWIGTSDGVEVYYKKEDQWKGFPRDHYPTESLIYFLLADSTAVWVGTDHGVLKYIKAEDRWRLFTTGDGLLDNHVHWILPDGDYIWFGTGRGLTRFYWNAPYRTD
jgi:ligand-binding sensor domain-containing protein